MEHLSSRILPRSSDPIVIISLEDGTVLDLNRPFVTASGYTQQDLTGRTGDDLLLPLGPANGPTVDTLGDPSSIRDGPVGLWTRSGDLRAATLSSLVLEVEGQRVAVCTIRPVREPTLGERRLAARERLDHVLRAHGRGQRSAVLALEAFARSLRWELAVLWQRAPGPERLRCAAVWNSSRSQLKSLQATTRGGALPGAMGPVARVWLRGEPTWVPDASADAAVTKSRGEAGAVEPVRGWLGFPVLGGGGVIGAAEFLSGEVRPPDARLLATIDDFGRRFGRLFSEGAGAAGGRSSDAETAPATVVGAFRELAGAVAATTSALEQHPTLPSQLEPPALLEELAAGIGRLNRLLAHAIDRSADRVPGPRPWGSATETAADLRGGLPTGLTLKAVSRRTGIPAATLRTWQRRYGFMRPLRSPGGYRLYGEEEIARIEQVKYLVGQGIRIGAAMEAVIRAAEAAAADGRERERPAG
jgi:hypothetical protein